MNGAPPMPDLETPIARAGALLAAGRAEEAEALLRGLLADLPGAVPARQALSTLLHRLGRNDEAIEEIAQAIRLAPNRLDCRTWLVSLLFADGKAALARQAAAAAEEEAARVLDYDPARRLAAFWSRVPDPPPPHPFLEWAWRVSGRADEVRPTWTVRAHWGWMADLLLVDWLVLRRADLSPIDRLCDPVDWTPLREHLAGGRGALLVGAHFGPKLAALDRLLRDGPPARWMTAHLAFATTARTPGFVNPFGDPNRIMLKVCRHLREGGLAFLSCDGRQSTRFNPIDLLGRRFGLPAGPPAIAFHGRATVFWYVARWRGGRIAFTLERGPTPDLGEPFEDWWKRWRAFVGERLTGLLLGTPENFQVGDGLARELAG